jgi:hypothetical protein
MEKFIRLIVAAQKHRKKVNMKTNSIVYDEARSISSKIGKSGAEPPKSRGI